MDGNDDDAFQKFVERLRKYRPGAADDLQEAKGALDDYRKEKPFDAVVMEGDMERIFDAEIMGYMHLMVETFSAFHTCPPHMREQATLAFTLLLNKTMGRIAANTKRIYDRSTH